MLWQTGVRAHELSGIKLTNIDREERAIRVHSDKTDSWRTVYYQPSLDFLIDQWLDGGYRDSYGPSDRSPYLFPSQRSDRLNTDSIGKIVKQAAEDAGIQEVMYEDAAGQPKHKITAHSLRHGHAVYALKSGIDIRVLQEHLGHSNLETTEVYLQLIDDDVKDAYRQFGSLETEDT